MANSGDRVIYILSKTFYSWVFQFGNDIEIVSPVTVREEFKRLCQGVLKQYR